MCRTIQEKWKFNVSSHVSHSFTVFYFLQNVFKNRSNEINNNRTDDCGAVLCDFWRILSWFSKWLIGILHVVVLCGLVQGFLESILIVTNFYQKLTSLASNFMHLSLWQSKFQVQAPNLLNKSHCRLQKKCANSLQKI